MFQILQAQVKPMYFTFQSKHYSFEIKEEAHQASRDYYLLKDTYM